MPKKKGAAGSPTAAVTSLNGKSQFTSVLKFFDLELLPDDFTNCIQIEVVRKNSLLNDLKKLESKLAQLENNENQTREYLLVVLSSTKADRVLGKRTRAFESLKKNIALTKMTIDTVNEMLDYVICHS